MAVQDVRVVYIGGFHRGGSTEDIIWPGGGGGGGKTRVCEARMLGGSGDLYTYIY